MHVNEISTYRVGDIRDVITVKDSYCEILSSDIRDGLPTRIYELNSLSEDMVRKPLQDIDSGGVGVYGLDEVILFGAGFVIRDACHIYCDRMCPTYVPNFIRKNKFSDAEFREGSLVSRNVDEVVFYICSRQAHIYGHFLLESLPKLLFAADVCRILDVPLKLVLDDRLPGFVKNMILLYAPEAIFLEYDGSKDYLKIRKLIVLTTLGRNHNYHSSMRLFFANFRQKALQEFSPSDSIKEVVGTGKGVFVSRLRHRQKKGWDSRYLDNEAELCEIATSMGMFVFEPQDFSFGDQVYLFSESSLISGEFSSALHNSIFRQRFCRVIALDRMNEVQERIAKLCGHELLHVIPPERMAGLQTDGVVWRFSIPPDVFKSAISWGLEAGVANR